MAVNVAELRQQAEAKRAEAETIYKGANEADRDPTAEERKRFDDLMGAVDALVQRATDHEHFEKRLNDADARAKEVEDGRPTGPHTDATNTRDGRHAYSVLKAIRQANPGNKGEQLDGIELEVSQEIARRCGQQPGGFYLPYDLPVRSRPGGPERRDLTTLSGAGAIGTTVATTLIEFLRESTLFAKIGGRVLTNVSGKLVLPRKTGTTRAHWVTESNAPPESNPEIGGVELKPRTMTAWTDVSRDFTLQTGLDAEDFLKADMGETLAVAADRVAFWGLGSNGEPMGVGPNPGINIVSLGANGGAITRAKLIEMRSKVRTANALKGNLAFVTSPSGQGAMEQVAVATGQAIFLWQDGKVGGYPAYDSTHVPENLTQGTGTNLTGVIFGNWADAVMAYWGGVDTVIDPFTGARAGNIRITMIQSADFALRHNESFSVIKDLDPAA